jgi:uncharacterized protein with von Willebrand factor type A (vWA) domain
MAGRYTIVSDGYDRDRFQEILEQDPAVARVRDRVGRLLPHPEAFLCDLFSALFKLNVELLPRTSVSAASLLHHRLMEAVLKSDQLAILRRRTQLDEVQAGAALVVLAEALMSSLIRDRRVEAEDLVAALDTAMDEDALEDREKQRAHLAKIPEGALGDDVANALDREIAALRKRIEAGRAAQEKAVRGLPLDVDVEIDRRMARLPKELEEADANMTSFGLGAGGEGKTSARQRLELGERLMASKKLQLLAKLVGAFREVAFEARRKRIARTPQELHSVSAGDDLMRLLPSELLGLPPDHAALHLDFLRRLAERQLLQYDLHGASERGPMVVCVDGSGSMQGSKELWAKAVALTLMEIARRERRGCLGIIFSSGGELFEVELLGKAPGRRGRAPIRSEEVFRFAEHFPGGGTSFEEPLARAVDAVARGSLRRGDIVFITDGEAQVSEPFLAEVARKKTKHRFAIRGILVDVAQPRYGGRPMETRGMETLERFCDDVRTVTDLTADSMKDLFGAV